MTAAAHESAIVPCHAELRRVTAAFAIPDGIVWVIRATALAECFDAMLTAAHPEERARVDRFLRQEDRLRFLACRCAVRQLLGAMTGVSPEGIRLNAPVNEKPTAPDLPGIDFSISHSGDYGMVGVVRSGSIGVDIEQARPLDDMAGMARLVMSAREHALYDSVTPEERQSLFYSIWTRKEAVMKETGRGFSMDPKNADVGMSEGPDGRVVFQTEHAPFPLKVAAGYMAAVSASAARSRSAS